MALADWDPRLIAPERALWLAGDWPVYSSFERAELGQYGDQPDRWQINLRCSKCLQSCGLLGVSLGQPGVPMGLGADMAYQTSIGDLLSGVLRHLVTAHDWSLSGAVQGQPPVKPEPGPPLVISGHEDHAKLITAITEADSE